MESRPKSLIELNVSCLSTNNCTAKNTMYSEANFIEDLEEFRFEEEDSFEGQALGPNLSLVEDVKFADGGETVYGSTELEIHEDGQTLESLHSDLCRDGITSSRHLRFVLCCLNTVTPNTCLVRQYEKVRQAH